SFFSSQAKCLRNISGICGEISSELAMERIVIDENKCTLCGQCKKACPFGAISLTDKVEVSSNCRLCKVCIGICPVGATDFEEES
ncbi:MAG: 4Fe-4S binding protein, partial [Lachnospiraceae bacterium]|nr:4Fe-4S binding protein [Lachnospiraceae bacterium]